MSKVQVDKVVNLSDDGAPQLTYGAELPVGYGLTGAGGLNITGVVTAASAVFSGNVTIGGTLTYEDVTNIDVVGVSTFAGRMNVNSSALFNEGLSVTAGVTTIAGAVDASSSTVTVNKLDLADTIVHGGDADTKIRFPAADTVSVETGGSERLRITGDGPHLLLGGTSDVNEITETSSNAGIVIGNTSDYGNGGLAIINTNTGTGRIYFGDGVTNSAGRNRGQINYYHNGDYMMFATAATERFRIASDGDVIIGGSSDAGYADYADNLTIHDTQNSGITIRSGIASQGAIYFSDATGSGSGTYIGNIIYDHSDNHMRFATSGSEAVRIDSSGRLLVGGTGNTESDVRLYLHNSSAAGSQIQITGSGSGTGNSDGFRLGYNGSGAQLWLFENEYLRFATNNEERLRIDASGNIGINKTSPNMGSHSTALTVSNVDSSARTAIEIEGNTSNCHAAIDFRSNGTLVSAINSRGTDRLQLCTGSSGNVKAEVTGDNFKIEDGDLVIGTSGHGIDFSATSDGSGTDSSELLADYEEGTWTPANTVGLTLVNNNTAYYVKVGKLVTVWFDISFRGYADSAQCSQIQGLPYAASSSSGYHSQSYNVWYSNTNSSARDYDDDNTLIYINGGDTTIRIWSVSGGHVRVRSWAVVDSNTGRRLRGTMTYMSA